ncbi:MAG: RluA family pseudouridine synthase [Gammaproteobacteria bacterium]
MINPDSSDPGKPRKPTETVQFITVPADEAGRRLDNYLMSLAPGVPRSRIYRAIRSGEVRIDKGRTKASYRLKAGDMVRVPPLRLPSKTKPSAGSKARETLLGTIIEKHKSYFVLNKPSGWAVHGGSGVSLGVIETLRQALPAEHKLELVHRLDRSTSGCLLIARKRSFLREMHRQIREDEMGKNYLMLVKGHWHHGRHICEVPLKTEERRGGERYVIPHPHGKYCRTDFEFLDHFGGVSFLRATLHTGRTHQIRVHCAHMGYPILGDDRYGDEDLEAFTQRLKIRRLCLHASSLSFEFPEGNPVQFDAPLSPEMVNLIERLSPRR